MALMPYRPHVGFIWHGSCEGQVTTYLPALLSQLIPVLIDTAKVMSARAYLQVRPSNNKTGAPYGRPGQTRGFYTQSRTRICHRTDCKRDCALACVIAHTYTPSCVRRWYRSLAYAIAMLADAITHTHTRLRSSCYMSSHTLWAKATGSAGRMPSTSRAWS